MRLRPGPNTPVANFKNIKEILLSKDLSRDSELDWTNDGLRFLDGTDMATDSVVFQSWPRTGNSMLRRYLEDVTGIFTGADGNIFTSVGLQTMGLVGEETTSDTNLVWITKTHWPLDSVNKGVFRAQKMIKIVRNPLDTILSQCHGMWTYSHSVTPVEQYDKDVPQSWETAVQRFSEGMADDFNITIKSPTSVANQIPSFVVRYEDLRKDPVPIIKDTFRFLLDVESIEGTVLEKRINEKCGVAGGPKALYKAKPSGTGLNRNAHMYSAKQIENLKVQLKDFLYHFGYASHPSEKNETAFFDFPEQEKADLAQFKHFEAQNKKMLASIGQPRHFSIIVRESSTSEKMAYFMLGIAICIIFRVIGTPSAGMLLALLAIGAACTYTTLGK